MPDPAGALAQHRGLSPARIAVPDEREEEVEKFREFLDHVSPEDFEEPQS